MNIKYVYIQCKLVLII